MTFRPSPGEELRIGELCFRVTEHPAAPGMAYGQSGRRGTVYQLVDDVGEFWALKVLLPQFSEPRLVGQAERIQPLASLPGLRACERQVLSSLQHVELIREHPDLDYAVLMPWIHGQTWLEWVLNKESVSAGKALTNARVTARVFLGMESRGLAHCDISGPNIILTPSGEVELVDLEEMYGPDLLRPEVLPGGSPGYAHRTAPDGLWHSSADRFAGSLLLVEMLGWCDERMREAAWGEGYFDPEEMQTNCERYHLLNTTLNERWGEELAKSFERAWFSDTLMTCPTFSKWLAALPEGVPERKEFIEAVETPSQEVEKLARDIDMGLKEEASSWVEELDIKDEPVKLAEEETWICPVCEREVGIVNEVCPYCEQGKREVRRWVSCCWKQSQM